MRALHLARRRVLRVRDPAAARTALRRPARIRRGMEAVTETTDAEDGLLCHLYKVLYDDIPNCGCNEPDAAFRLVHDIMLLAPLHSGTWVKARELIGSDGAFQIVLAAMTDAGLLEHGGSMGGSWLGKRGRWFLWAVEQV